MKFPPFSSVALAAWLALAVSGFADSPRRVFAHYMVCYTGDVEFCKREIRLAQQNGIDGFALNTGAWLDAEGKPGVNVAAVERMYEAARELNSGFELFLSADATGKAAQPDNQVDMVRRFAAHPNQLKQDGKPVFSAWAGSPETYRPALERLAEAGTPACFVPFLSFPPYPANLSERRVRSYFEGSPWMDGFFYFAPDQTVPEMIWNNAAVCKVTRELGKICMAGVSPAYNSSNLRDYRGMQGYDAVWKGIIRDRADWVEIVTWNDYQEDSNLMPFRFSSPALGEQFYLSRDASFLDMTAYASAWFKSGRQPSIPQDKLYYAYRNRPKTATRAWDPVENRWIDVTREEGSQRFMDQIHDDVEDMVYVTTFLKEPAELSVSLGGKRQTFRQPAGIVHVACPMRPGVPHFELARKGKPLLAMDGRREIIARETKENSVNGAHLLNRTWTGGGAVGTPIHLAVAEGERLGEASVLRNGAAVAVPDVDGSGLRLAVSGLKTGTYNVRVRYRNTGGREARLTLLADGTPLAKGTAPHFLPLFLPPTGASAGTSSFFWSLFEETRQLTLICQTPDGLKPGAHPWARDRGGVEIEAVELVAVESVAPGENRTSRFPELVNIPGGVFQMGANAGAPDEKPVHQVRLSPFAMGKYEVTNDEYERFDPAHRRLRDSFSWRGADPVIYVSWRDAARYCNWLSRQNGLEPVYDETTWRAAPALSGFRLPSEAQWEYVASGRGEGRRYPWGNQTPTPERGNYLLHAALDSGAALLGLPRGNVTPVGSYEKGASRDGVMDLAGNVSEWCGDVYAPYSGENGVLDPLREGDGRYRSIWGGSWGYYNYSQTVAAREFNSPVYPGYVYIGFRVALPEAGWQKLTQEVQ